MDERIANMEQAEHWDGDGSAHWVKYQDEHDALLAPLNTHLFDAAAIAEQDRILDVGCGCGVTTRIGARAAAGGDATGIDLSAAMLERARALAREDGLTNVSFVQGDAQVHPFREAEFDLAISRFGVMFFADPIAAFANLVRATKGRGRLAFLCWQDLLQNDWILVPAAAALGHVPPPDLGAPDDPGPFSLADPERLRSILGAAGWHDVALQEVREQLVLGTDADGALRFFRDINFARRLFAGVDEAAADRALEAVHEALAQRETSDGVALGSAAWVVSARR